MPHVFLWLLEIFGLSYGCVNSIGTGDASHTHTVLSVRADGSAVSPAFSYTSTHTLIWCRGTHTSTYAGAQNTFPSGLRATLSRMLSLILSSCDKITVGKESLSELKQPRIEPI